MSRCAVIGVGHWGKNLARNLYECGALAAICDGNTAQAQQYADKFEVPLLSIDDILNDKTIDAMVLATPASTHAHLATKALQHDKDVFVEKPLALTVADAQAVIDLAKQRERILMVGHLMQYHPAFIRLKQIVADGTIGRLQYLYSNRLSFGKIRREEDILWSFAPHDISMLLALTQEAPVEVNAHGSYHLHPHIADVTTTHLTFPSGVTAHIFVSWLHPFKEQKLVVVGDKGMLVFNDSEPWEQKLQLYPHCIDWVEGAPTPNKAEHIAIELTQGEPLRLECQHFLDAIKSRQAPRTHGDEGLAVLDVLERAAASLKQDKKSATTDRDNITIHPTATIDAGASIGPQSKIWHYSHIMSGAKLGAHVTVGQNVMIADDVSVGDGCKIQNNVSLYKGVTLEENVFCGPSCVFTNVNAPRAHIEQKDNFKPTLVKKGATIGANATIVCGHRIGAYSFIAAGAVVTSDVADYALMAGVPAKRIGWVSRVGARLGDDLVCPKSGERYQLNTGGQLHIMRERELAL